MPSNLKALIVVLALAAVVFVAAKPLGLLASSERDFARRRNVWLLLTVIGFVSPSFWLFTLVAAPVLIWAGRKDSNPVALYLLLLHVIPPVRVEIPAIAVNRLFSLDMYRLLSFFVLLPVAWRWRRSRSTEEARRFRLMDWLLLGYGAFQILLFVRPDIPNAAALHDSVTNMLRRAFLFVVDVYLVYYAVSRSCSNRRAIVDAMASFCLGVLIMAPIAIFESTKHWLLYAEMSRLWGIGQGLTDYIPRAGIIRATVSSGNPLALGYLLAVAWGCWLYLRGGIRQAWLRTAVPLLLLLGLVAAYSRGPWVGALLIYFAFAALGPRATPRVFKASVVAALFLTVVFVSPLGGRITKVVPFLGGSVGSATITYRERLIDRSIAMVRKHPLLGDQNAYAKLQKLRTGVGIVDFVNTYADIAVFRGLAALAVFLGFILAALIKAYRMSRAAARADPDTALMGASIVACILGTLLMLYTSSFILAFGVLFYVLAGLAAAYSRLHLVRARTTVRANAYANVYRAPAVSRAMPLSPSLYGAPGRTRALPVPRSKQRA